MRVLALLLVALAGAACGPSRASEERPRSWTVGFWYWSSWGAPDRLEGAVDSVYLLARGGLPESVPPAREYWLVYRYDRQAVPEGDAAAQFLNDVGRGLSAARRRAIPVRGVQFDIDSPTAALPKYAAFLREARRELPRGMEVSITALLDWFRPGTAIGDVIREVDEFAPQFYDIADPERSGPAIAAPIDAARWGPVFNRFQKPFRIGISTFGRVRSVHKDQTVRGIYFDRVTPLDLAMTPAFQLRTRRNQASELALTWRAARAEKSGMTNSTKATLSSSSCRRRTRSARR